jgi:hypothetical protein
MRERCSALSPYSTRKFQEPPRIYKGGNRYTNPLTTFTDQYTRWNKYAVSAPQVQKSVEQRLAG